MGTESTYTVLGMTCGHCVQAVTTEVGRLAGVSAVVVDLPTGRVEVTSVEPLAWAEISAAVADAGYSLAS